MCLREDTSDVVDAVQSRIRVRSARWDFEVLFTELVANQDM